MAGSKSRGVHSIIEESYPIFTLSSIGLGAASTTAAAPAQIPLLPPPPCVEVLRSEESSVPKSVVDTIVINDGLALLKGRVSTFDVFGLANSDLVPGKYEGGLKLWEGSMDLVKSLYSEVQEGRLELKGKRVLELGCGHGLPGIFTALEGASVVHFQDFNAEVLRCLTVPNVDLNLPKGLDKTKVDAGIGPDIRFFAGDWNEIHRLLPYYHDCGQKHARDPSLEGVECQGYDVILMAETVYSLSSFDSLYSLIKQALHQSSGVIYMAGKKHYFGVGGGTRQFLHLVEEDGIMDTCLLAEVADGSSNVREVWKLSVKQTGFDAIGVSKSKSWPSLLI